MKFSLPDYLLLFVLFALPKAAYTQCNPGNYCPPGMPEWTQDPPGGCVAASESELDCASGTMPTGPSSYQPSSWCTTIENNIFYPFEAQSPGVVFDVAAFNCQGGNGALQAAILDCNLNFVSDCYGNIPDGTSQPVPSTTPLTVGETYLLMLDGSAGSICDFIINGAIPADPFGLNVCVGGNTGLNVGTYTANQSGTWTINPPNAGIITSPNPGSSVTIEWLLPGQHEVCISVCPNGQSSCLNVEIGENIEEFVGPDLVCLGEMYMCGETPVMPPAPGVWEFVDIQPNGECQLVTTCTVHVPEPAFTFINHAMCADEFFEVCEGNFTPPPVTGIWEYVCTGPNGCDSVVTINLVSMDPTVEFEPPIEVGCGNNWMGIISGLASPGWFDPFIENTTLQWTGPGPIPTPNEILIEVTVPGEYCLSITHETFGVVCSDEKCIEIQQTLSLPDPPNLSGPTNVCGGMETYTVSPVGNAVPDGYTWTTPNGEPYTNQGNFSIIVNWANSPGGQLCVTADNFCGSSAPTCINVNVGTGPPTPDISGPTAACDGDVLTYTLNNPSPGATCTWTVPPGASFNQTGNSINVDFEGASSGNVCITCMDQCGTSPQTCIAVDVDRPPSAPTFTSGPNQVCANTSAQYCVNQDPDATSWSWTTPVGNFPNTNSNCLNVNWLTNGGNICVTANNHCGASPQTCFNVAMIPAPTAALTGQGEFCAGSGETIDLTINLTGTAPWTVTYSLNGGNPMTITDIQASPYTWTVSQAGTYSLVTVTDGGICPGTASGSATVIENPLPEAFLSGGGDICQGSGDKVDLLIGLTGEAPWEVVYQNGAGVQSTLTINASPFQLPIGQNGAGTITLISVVDNNDCIGTVSGSAQVNVLGSPTTSVVTECDATSTVFTVTITIQNGDPASYSVTPLTGTLNGNVFTSDPIPSGSGYEFIVNDANNCNPKTVSDDIVVCNCLTKVGEMDQTTLTDCGDGPITGIYDPANQNLDGNDAQAYVLHSGNSASIVDPILNISTEPIVNFDPTIGMAYGVTYYLSAVVGDEDPATIVNLDDPCLQVAQGTPVIFYEVPTATIAGSTEICVGESAELTFELTGIAPWTVTLNGNIIDIFSSPYIHVVSPNTTRDYVLSNVTDANCSNAATGTETVTVNTSPEIINVSETCNGSGTAYTVVFEITGGDPSCYTVTPMDGTLTGNIFTSNQIPDGQGYHFEVTDCNNCPADIVEKPLVDCNCLSEAGNMTPGTVDVCGDEITQVNYEGGEILDDDDALCFVLHAGDVQSPIATNPDAPEFTFDPANMTIGTTYFICPVVGNDDGSGCVDLSDICLSVGGCVQVKFRAIPTATIVAGSDICAGDAGTVEIAFTGTGPWTFEYQDDGGNTNSLEVTNNPYMLNVSPDATTSYNLLSVQGKFCAGTVDGTAVVNVNTAPEATVLSLDCNSTSTAYTITIEITGGDPNSYSVLPADGFLDGNIFISNFYQNQESFAFLVDDANGCGPVELEGSHVCFCLTDAGVMSTDQINYCIGDQMVGEFTVDETLDTDDNLVYILHTESGDQLGTIIATNKDEPVFDWDPANMTTGTIYYISAVAGNGTTGGNVNLNDPCLSVTPGTPVLFNDLPEATISGSNTICNGDQTNVTFELVGTGPFEVVFEIDGIAQPVQTIPLPGSFDIPVNPSQSVSYSLVSITDLGVGCSNAATGEIEIIVNQPVNAGDKFSDYEICDEFNSTLSLFENLVGYDYGGMWTDDIGNEYPNGSINTKNFTPGTYTFTYTVAAEAPCPDDSEQVVLTIHPTPVADAGPMAELDCNVNSVQIGGPNTSPGMTYLWNGNVSNPNIPYPTIEEAGEFILTVTSPFGCVDKDTVYSFVSNEQPNPAIVASDISCFGMNDGFIQIESISGGEAPYTVSFNGSEFTQNMLYINLTAGSYSIIVEDANGCQSSEIILGITEPQELNVTLEPNIEGNPPVVEEGFPILIQVVTNPSIPFNELDTVIWSASNNFNDSLLCLNCEYNEVTLDYTTTFSIMVAENDCTDEDQLTLYVNRDHLIYVPNAFSPNGRDDDENEVFKLYGSSNVVKVKSFLIFNRWGETVHEYYNFTLDDPMHGWNGMHRGEFMNPGVFAWTAEVEFEDNVFRFYKGDVTLLR